MEEKLVRKRRVLLVPAPAQGHITPMIQLATILYSKGAVTKFKLPNVILSTTSATAFVCRFVMCKLYAKDGLAPLKEGGGREEELVPELDPIRYKDLPTSVFATIDCSVELFKKTCYKGTASSMIVNTVRCLETSSLDWLQQELELPVYPIGPLHLLASAPPTSLLEENESCIEWLNKRKPSSVIYISLGSFTLLETKEMLELASGLVSSNQHFLWVIRPGSIRDSELSDNEELVRKMVTSDQGYIVKWAPQKQVLAHSAVGAFWSHCGWNSTLESLGEGVPLICRPFTTDQK
ncbi:hypothetical protein AALP_AA6G352800, partial [Arabis alpina]